MFGEVGLGLSPMAFFWTGAVVAVAAFVRGYSGFGFSAILMIGLLPVIPVSQLVPLSIALEILASSSQAPRILPDVNRRYLLILLCASVIGAPVGVFLLHNFSERGLRFTVYSVVFVSALGLLLLKSRPFGITYPKLFIAGVLAGVVNGATALSGLVLALFFSGTTIGSRTMRATMIAYLFFTDLITGAVLLATNLYDVQTLWRVLVTVPFLLLGVWLGSRQFLKTPSASFKALVLWLLLGFCAIGIIQML